MSPNRLKMLEELVSERADSTLPKSLRREELHEAPEVFSFRAATSDRFDQRNAIADMRDHVQKTGKPLDRIMIVWTARGWAVVDGYLRLKAYKAAKWSSAIPVRVFKGTPSEALQEALAVNRKVAVALTKSERMDGAWFLVLSGGLTRKQTAERTGVSLRQVKYMRKARDEIRAAGEDPADLDTWREARNRVQEMNGGAIEFDEEQAVEDLRQQLGRTFGTPRRHLIEPFARALALHFGSQADDLLRELRQVIGEPDEFDEYDEVCGEELEDF